MGRSTDGVDGLLREFFRGEMPNPWPATPIPTWSLLPFQRSASWGRRMRSALALAASLIILALSLGLLSDKFADRSPTSIRNSDGTGRHDKPYKDSSPHGLGHPEKK
jgi:hypothetical protein